jgi:hypothetical protein
MEKKYKAGQQCRYGRENCKQCTYGISRTVQIWKGSVSLFLGIKCHPISSCKKLFILAQAKFSYSSQGHYTYTGNKIGSLCHGWFRATHIKGIFSLLPVKCV